MAKKKTTAKKVAAKKVVKKVAAKKVVTGQALPVAKSNEERMPNAIERRALTQEFKAKIKQEKNPAERTALRRALNVAINTPVEA